MGKLAFTCDFTPAPIKALLSAQLLELGSKKYLQPYPAVLSVRTLDNGRYHMLDNLTELPFKEAGQRVISKGYLNLQNRHDLLEVEAVTPGEWMEFDFDLQPTIYKLEKGQLFAWSFTRRTLKSLCVIKPITNSPLT